MFSTEPQLMVPMQLGGISFSTRDLLAEIDDTNFLCQVEMKNYIRRAKGSNQDYYPHNIIEQGLTIGRTHILTVQGGSSVPVAGSSAAEEDVPGTNVTFSARGAAVDTANGRKHVSVDEYMSIALEGNYSHVVLMADEVPFGTSQKRTGKALERTRKWFSQQVSTLRTAKGPDIFIFGVVIVSAGPEKCAEQAGWMVANGADGISVGGLGQGESQAERRSAIEAVRNTMDIKVPIAVLGIDGLRDIIGVVEAGASIVASNCAARLTARRAFLSLNLGVATQAIQGEARGKKRKSDLEVASEGPFARSSALSSSSVRMPQSGDVLDPDLVPEAMPIELDIRDTSFVKDVKPLVLGCSCHACRNHTRAYIHHLQNSRELLGEVLLFNHNLHQLLGLFRDLSAAKMHNGPSQLIAMTKRLLERISELPSKPRAVTSNPNGKSKHKQKVGN
jgi:queuine tRNA-ribosyltransferase subunit QTRTD1